MSRIKYGRNLCDNSAIKLGSLRNSTRWYKGTSSKGQGKQPLVPPVCSSSLPKDALELCLSHLSWGWTFATGRNDHGNLQGRATLCHSRYHIFTPCYREGPGTEQGLESRVSGEWTISQVGSFTSTVLDPWFCRPSSREEHYQITGGWVQVKGVIMA